MVLCWLLNENDSLTFVHQLGAKRNCFKNGQCTDRTRLKFQVVSDDNISLEW